MVGGTNGFWFWVGGGLWIGDCKKKVIKNE